MKKIQIITVLIICLIAGTSTVAAQLRIGIKGNVGIIDHKIKSDILSAKNRLGFSIGPTLDWTIASGWGLDGSLLYGHKQYSIKEIDKYKDQFEMTDYNYVAIPINIKKRIDFDVVGIYVAAGPYGAVKINGGDLKSKFEEAKVGFKSKNFEFGINAGFGISLFSHVDLGITYKCRLSDNFKADEGDLGSWDGIKELNDKKYQSWEAGLTYYF